jgi:hypothetical protein
VRVRRCALRRDTLGSTLLRRGAGRRTVSRARPRGC